MKKPSEQEEEYFVRQEFERKKRLEEERQQTLHAEERRRLKDLHHMRCPKCGMALIEIDYKGVQLDKCSACDGVWLDANELDAILEIEQKNKTFLTTLFGIGAK